MIVDIYTLGVLRGVSFWKRKIICTKCPYHTCKPFPFSCNCDIFVSYRYQND